VHRMSHEERATRDVTFGPSIQLTHGKGSTADLLRRDQAYSIIVFNLTWSSSLVDDKKISSDFRATSIRRFDTAYHDITPVIQQR
jgi:hypothetical protein